MSGRNQNGFTVIETTIFMAVSALLFVSILATTGTALARQRYTDSVRSTESFLQQQIDKTSSFSNTRNGSQVCSAGAISSGSQAAGTSNCYVLGKALRFSQGSSIVTIYNVVGTEPADIISNGAYKTTTDETTVLDSYQPRAVMNVEVENYEAPWGARFVGASQNAAGVPPTTPINTVLFLRSPRSGGLLTYTTTWPSIPQTGGTVLLSGATDPSRLQKVARLCMQSQDFIGMNSLSEIRLTGEGGQSAIQAEFDVAGRSVGTPPCNIIP